MISVCLCCHCCPSNFVCGISDCKTEIFTFLIEFYGFFLAVLLVVMILFLRYGTVQESKVNL